MAYQLYQMTAQGMRTGWTPGGMHLDIGARDYNGHDLAPIVAIDRDRKMYQRDGGSWQLIPSDIYTTVQITWDSETE